MIGDTNSIPSLARQSSSVTYQKVTSGTTLASGDITVQTSGTYLVVINGGWTTERTNGRRYLGIGINGPEWWLVCYETVNKDGFMTATTVTDLSAGDIINIHAYQDSGADIYFTGKLYIIKIGGGN